jgi:predicted unusual protein kinase regulating ubiquinone biosynthesis (AarF/ABC1/UbiB family)
VASEEETTSVLAPAVAAKGPQGEQEENLSTENHDGLPLVSFAMNRTEATSVQAETTSTPLQAYFPIEEQDQQKEKEEIIDRLSDVSSSTSSSILAKIELDKQVSSRKDDDPKFSNQPPSQQQQQQQQQLPVVPAAAAEAEATPWATVSRAAQIGQIVFGKVVFPLMQSLHKADAAGFPNDWDEFWNRTPYAKANTNAMIFALALEELGPTYVKFGQALSARPDVIPRPLANALSTLQDSMQPFDTNVARAILRSELSELGGGGGGGEGDSASSSIIRMTHAELEELVQSLSPEPVAAASIGQVYSAYLPASLSSSSSSPTSSTSSGGIIPQRQKVAIKVKRPGIREIVQQDAALLRSTVSFLESLPSIPQFWSGGKQQQQSRLIATELVQAVDEFMSRIFEELDYQKEAKNLALFASLYSHRRHQQKPPPTNDKSQSSSSSSSSKSKTKSSTSSNINVVVPQVYPNLCTENVLIMEWIEGTKLVDDETLLLNADPLAVEENLKIIEQGIQCTLSQLLDTGVMHADPHQGNLFKVKEVVLVPTSTTTTTTATTTGGGTEPAATTTTTTITRLGYVDFGLLSIVPPSVRDGLVCAVAQLIFARNVTAVAVLFGELSLLPAEVLDDPVEREAFAAALTEVLDQVLLYEDTNSSTTSGTTTTTTTTIPTLRFDKLLDALTRLVPRFRFELPPYFINNARALSTLEGMARELKPTFNVLQVLYPYALNRLLSNPNQNPVVEDTLQSLIRSPITQRVDVKRVQTILEDSAFLTGYSKGQVVRDILSSDNGARLARLVVREELTRPLRRQWNKSTNLFRL